jgi:hypothetical protein
VGFHLVRPFESGSKGKSCESPSIGEDKNFEFFFVGGEAMILSE